MNTKRKAGLPNTLLPEQGFISDDPDFFNVKHAKMEAMSFEMGINDSVRSTVSNGDMSLHNVVEAHQFLSGNTVSPVMERTEAEEADELDNEEEEKKEIEELEKRLDQINISQDGGTSQVVPPS